MATLIHLVQLIEHANWQESSSVMHTLNIDKAKVAKFYSDALLWADQQVKLTA